MSDIQPRREPTIFFSAGDPSGDLHAANLIRALRKRCPQLRTVGYGGAKMLHAGCRLHADLTESAVMMWIARVAVNLHKFWFLLRRADQYFRNQRPDAVVLVDFPGLNWWIARKAKARGIPVFYFAPPQTWARAHWRVRKMRQLVDHVLCSLPFEQTWYSERGCRAHYVGHPYFDELFDRQLDKPFLVAERNRRGQLVTILPGSRSQEVAQNLRALLKAAAVVGAAVPQARFAVACLNQEHAQLAERMAARTAVPVEIYVGKTSELIHLADCTMAVCGSVSLELLHNTKPTVILYQLSRLAYRLQNRIRKVKYVTLVNLLDADDPFCETRNRLNATVRAQIRCFFPST